MAGIADSPDEDEVSGYRPCHQWCVAGGRWRGSAALGAGSLARVGPIRIRRTTGSYRKGT